MEYRYCTQIKKNVASVLFVSVQQVASTCKERIPYQAEQATAANCIYSTLKVYSVENLKAKVDWIEKVSM
jgi:hypothetical protein